MGKRELLGLALVHLSCAGAPEAAPQTEAIKTEKPAATAAKEEEEESPATDAALPDAAPAYTEPPPRVIRRHHVFATMRARAAKKVVITSVLTTAADEAETLAPGTEAILEFKAKGSKEWIQVADVIVKKVARKGSRVRGTERQEIVLEITTKHPGATAKGRQSPFRRNARVRLQVDRQEPAGGGSKTEPISLDKQKVFSLVVSFTSHGTGTDRAAKDRLRQAIDWAQQTGKMKLFHRIADWGKEGESDYCFPLRSKSGVTRDFVKKVERIAKQSSRVHIRRDAPCRKGR